MTTYHFVVILGVTRGRGGGGGRGDHCPPSGPFWTEWRPLPVIKVNIHVQPPPPPHWLNWLKANSNPPPPPTHWLNQPKADSTLPPPPHWLNQPKADSTPPPPPKTGQISRKRAVHLWLSNGTPLPYPAHPAFQKSWGHPCM